MSSKSRQKNGNTQPKSNMSFAQLMSAEQLNRLKPYIDEQVRGAQATLSRQQLAALADLTVSITAIKRTLIKGGLTTDADFKLLKIDIEDESYGLAKVEDGAKENDFVRLTLGTSYVLVDKDGKELDNKDLGNQEVDIPRLRPDAGRVAPQVLEGLVEMKAGENKTVTFEQASSQGTYKITNVISVTRVSRPNPPAGAPK